MNETAVQTTGPASALRLESWRPGLRADAEDLAVIALPTKDSEFSYNFPKNFKTATSPTTIPGSAVPTAIRRMAFFSN